MRVGMDKTTCTLVYRKNGEQRNARETLVPTPTLVTAKPSSP